MTGSSFTQSDCLKIDRFLDSHATYGETAISVMASAITIACVTSRLASAPRPAPSARATAEATPMTVRYALSNNIGLGGHNGAVIFKRYDGD